MKLEKSTLQNMSRKAEEPDITDVSTYNPRNPELFSVIESNFSIQEEDCKIHDISNKLKLIKSKHQPNNFKRISTKAKFKYNSGHEVKHCHRPNCGLCSHLMKGTCVNTHETMLQYVNVHETITCEVNYNLLLNAEAVAKNT